MDAAHSLSVQRTTVTTATHARPHVGQVSVCSGQGKGQKELRSQGMTS